MFDALEAFLGRHEHTVAALEAASTTAAVFVSLVLAFGARRASLTHLRARVLIHYIVQRDVTDPDNPPAYLTAFITNTGIAPLTISPNFFHWRVPLRKGAWAVPTPLDFADVDPLVRHKAYPVEIAPRTTGAFVLTSLATFQNEIRQHFVNPRSFKEWCQFRFLRAGVMTDDGTLFRATLDSTVRDELRKIRAKSRRPRRGERA
jgi:hypothetical protein